LFSNMSPYVSIYFVVKLIVTHTYRESDGESPKLFLELNSKWWKGSVQSEETLTAERSETRSSKRGLV
jgi:hypothetical protein